MPIYEYQCRGCEHEFETIQKMSEAPLTQCPSCGKDLLKKKISAVAFRLKGGGWYETDFKSGDKKNVASSSDSSGESSSSDSSKKESNKESKGESKSNSDSKGSASSSESGSSSSNTATSKATKDGAKKGSPKTTRRSTATKNKPTASGSDKSK